VLFSSSGFVHTVKCRMEDCRSSVYIQSMEGKVEGRTMYYKMDNNDGRCLSVVRETLSWYPNRTGGHHV
jgi:hypothetical protein